MSDVLVISIEIIENVVINGEEKKMTSGTSVYVDGKDVYFPAVHGFEKKICGVVNEDGSIKITLDHRIKI